MHNRKTVLLQHACLLSKNNLVQKSQKMMTSNVWHCFCTYCTNEHRSLLHFGMIMSQRLVVHKSVGNKTKSIRPKLRPRPKQLQDQDQDRGRSETGLVIRPRSQRPQDCSTAAFTKTDLHTNIVIRTCIGLLVE